MSFWDRDTDDWFRRWFGGSSRRMGLPGFGREMESWFGGGGGIGDIVGQFDEMRREIERMFENIQTISQGFRRYLIVGNMIFRS
jgi:hypothetical protein